MAGVTRREVIAAGGAVMMAAASRRTSAQQGRTVRVMSFNIRYGTANDGDNHWDRRKAFLAEVVRAEAPDLLGVQEALDAQLRFLTESLPDYGVVGVGRDDGIRAGEYSAILYRRSRFAVQRTDTFWFSDTPSVVASKHWGNSIPRICTWAQFVTPEGGAIAHYNLHLDHQSQPSRERSIALLRQRLDARDPKVPAVVTGDFNAGEDNPAVRAMTADGTWRDTFRLRHPSASPVGTFTAFRSGNVGGDKIDYVFVSPEWQVLDAAIIRTERAGRYPSDHFPVTATLQLV